MTGTNRAHPGLNHALAAVRAGDTLVVPKLDRFARSVPGPAQLNRLQFQDRPTISYPLGRALDLIGQLAIAETVGAATFPRVLAITDLTGDAA